MHRLERGQKKEQNITVEAIYVIVLELLHDSREIRLIVSREMKRKALSSRGVYLRSH